MTGEELKRLLALGDAGYSEAWFELEDMAPTLARKVIAAEKLAEALRTGRDYVSDASNGGLVFTSGREVSNEMTTGDLALIDAALAAWEQAQ